VRRPGLQLLTLALVLHLIGIGAGAQQARAAASTFSGYRGGAKAVYLLLDDLGYRTSRIFDFQEVDKEIDVLMQIGPDASAPVNDALAWVRKGHQLVLALPLAELSGVCADVRYGSLTLRRHKPKDLTKTTKHPDLKIRKSECALKVPQGGKALVGTDGAALAVHLPLGKGEVLLLAHEDLLINANLNKDDLAVVLRRWLSDNAPARGKVAFFEQRGEGAGVGTIVSMMRRAGLGPFLLHGIVWLLLLYWALTPRFGDPRPVERSTRREFSQHARALGHLYQRRRSSAQALKHQYVRFLNKVLGRAEGGGVNTGAGARKRRGLRDNRAALSALIATRTGRDPDGVESLLAQVEYTVTSAEQADTKDVQRHFRLGQSLAALQHSSAARTKRRSGAKRGRTTNR
jgi:hypothetical protein